MKSKSAYNISRVGQWNTGIKNRPNCSPPVTSIGFKGRSTRDWSTYNNDLGARFALSGVIGTLDPTKWLTGKRGGNQKMYTDQIIMVLAKLKALLNLPLRGVCTMLEDYVGTHQIVVPIPHYSTVSRRVKVLKWRMPRPVSGDWTMDSSGFGVSGTGEYFNVRFNVDPKAKYKKLHVMSDLADGRIIAATFTGSTGKGTGDVSQGRKLLDQVDAVFNSVSADGAYDSETFRTQARDKGGNLLCPLPTNAVYGKDKPLRNELKHQVGKIGDEEWRKRSGYSYRALAETVFSVLKRCLGARLRARSYEGQKAEIMARVSVYNDWVVGM